MRKGRSSRRSRSLRPLVSVRPEALGAEAGVETPRVITPSAPPVSGIDSEVPPSVEAKGGIDGIPSSSISPDPFPSRPPPTFEDPTESVAPPADLSSTKIDGSATLVDATADIRGTRLEEELRSDRARFAATLAFGSSVVPSTPAPEPAPQTTPEPPAAVAAPVEAAPAAEAAPIEPTPVSPVFVAPIVSVEPPREERPAEPPAAPAAQPVAAAKTSAVDPDEISVPPAGDQAEVAEEFFSEADLSRHLAQEQEAIEGDPLTVEDSAKRKSDPFVVQRRARFAKYVKWAVAGAAVVCLAAVARSGFTSKSTASSGSVQSAPIVAPEAKAAAPAAQPVAEPKPVVEAKPEEAKPAADAKPEEAKPEEIVGNAKEEKAKSRSFLEKQKLADAIEAGERAVKLDPTDGEAWLILGAAYQEKGNMAEARRAYGACVKEATTGPKIECQKMLR